jgi:hypothetical protein
MKVQAMLDKIAPGSKVSVKVTKKPTNAAAAKTLVRLLSKDRAHKANTERLRKARVKHFSQNRRGGRFWDVNVVKQHPLDGSIGESGTITATLDVLRDLASVSRFVEVTKA